MEDKQKSKSFATINLKSFILVSGLLLAILCLAGTLSYFVPQGHYSFTEDGAIIPGTFVKGSVEGIAIWRVVTAPVRVFFSSDAVTIIMICAFLLIMSGVFNIMEKTNGINVFISKTVAKFSSKKQIVIYATVFLFMIFGSFFGMYEELITLLPVVIIFMLKMGFDTLTGLGVCLLSACFGFASAMTNPFSVGLASEIAGVHVFNGVWLRLVFFIIIYAVLCTFITLHVKKISKNPTSSLTYEIDREKLLNNNFTLETSENDGKIYKTYSVFFITQLVILLAIASIRAISDFAIPILAGSFLIGGIICGLITCENKSDTFKHFFNGFVAMLPAVVMIAIASSVKLVLNESNIVDTIMNAVITSLDGKSKFVCVLLIYFLILFLQLFIGSASAKLMLIMPIIIPISGALGISPATVILTYCIADGFTDAIIPTNPILLIALSVAQVPYTKWLKWTWLLQLLIFAITVLLLLFAVTIGY